eukprot:2767031-Amphidinium_carterae.1
MSHLDYSHINTSDYYDLVDEDNRQPLDAQKVAEGLNREMSFLEEQRLGEPVLRKNVIEKSIVWTTRILKGPQNQR